MVKGRGPVLPEVRCRLRADHRHPFVRHACPSHARPRRRDLAAAGGPCRPRALGHGARLGGDARVRQHAALRRLCAALAGAPPAFLLYIPQPVARRPRQLRMAPRGRTPGLRWVSLPSSLRRYVFDALNVTREKIAGASQGAGCSNLSAGNLPIVPLFSLFLQPRLYNVYPLTQCRHGFRRARAPDRLLRRALDAHGVHGGGIDKRTPHRESVQLVRSAPTVRL